MRLERAIFSVMLLACWSAPLFAQEDIPLRSPTLLDDVSDQMLTPGFWIQRHPSADKLIMTPQQIAEFNQSIRQKIKVVKDFFSLPETFSGDELAKQLRQLIEDYRAKAYYSESGEPVSDLLLQDISSQLNLTSIPSVIEPQFGFVRRDVPQRFLPTDEKFLEQPLDVDFDYLQNNTLELAAPVVVLHKSFDGQWGYVLGPTSDGWVKLNNIVSCSLNDIQNYLSSTSSVVVIAPRADIYLDPQLTQWLQSVQMGARFPKEKKQESADVAAVKIPYARSDGRYAIQTVYMAKDQVHDGFLPYTVRTIYSLAFRLLNHPYGWGGMYGGQDCSRFIQEIFAVVGVELPRDSKDQAKVGENLIVFDPVSSTTAQAEKKQFFTRNYNGALILTLKGHIMLYLGSVDGISYAIHSVWAYRTPVDGASDRVHVVNRVAVSSLDLGEGSQKGSLLKRLQGVRIFSNTTEPYQL